ncbi:alginate O-acetyltransferase AlgX-related protein [Lacinutrix venerupis]|uniref:AlgX/AlgJ SGNH hydrolase-like domain-containing protein n=1 Tax=Lacinutrix venerupis TaxID=1486034 RepID=A0AAC9LME0_9FLAO|nr:hypothetical protein [Lacinutrix venerupis]APY01381.1 hypothetical protein BWR22_14080 [Lacinutrix venerupis]
MFTKRKIKISFDFRTLIFVLIFSPMVLSIINLGVQKIINPGKKVKLSFKNNYIPKDQLLSLNRNIKETLFGTQLIPERAVKLKNGWFVIGDFFSDALSESKGLIVFSKEEINQLKNILIERNSWLEKNNIKFYLTVPPNKLTVYDSLIPIRKRDRNTKMEQIDSLCQAIGVPFINLGEDFKNHPDKRLYHKTDTHWNDYGGFYGYSTAIKRFEKDFPNQKFKHFDFNKLEKFTTNTLHGDLAKITQIDNKEEYLHLKLDTTFAEVIKEKKYPIPEGYNKEPSNFELRFKNSKGNLKLLAYRDSFFGYCNPFFIENFEETVLFWDHNFNKDVILNEKPDIVIIEVLERDLDILLSNKT